MSYKKTLKSAASPYWPQILTAAGIPSLHLDGNVRPCPICGGYKFRWDNRHNDGGYWCGDCGPSSGINLIMKVNDWTFHETIRHIAKVVGEQ